MKILSKSIAFFFVITFIAIQANAQVQILEKNALEKIQNGHSHVVVNELHFPESEDFLDVFKKYWTLTKGVDFISSENLSGSLVAGDSYFSIEALHITGYYGSQQIYYYLNLWVPSAKSLKDKNFKIEHEEELAHIAISADFGTMKETMKTNGMFFDFNSEGRLFHWHPGLLKNYLQLLTAELKTGKKMDYHDDMTDKSQVKALSTQTLFIAEDNLNKVTAFVNKQKVMDIKEITKDYKFNYESISDRQLGEKILEDKEQFYYILYIRNSSSKLVSIINSRTGEIIYSRYEKSMSNNFKSSDLKELSKLISNN